MSLGGTVCERTLTTYAVACSSIVAVVRVTAVRVAAVRAKAVRGAFIIVAVARVTVVRVTKAMRIRALLRFLVY